MVFSDDYVIVSKKLGEGGGGIVYQGFHKCTNEIVAIKIVYKCNTTNHTHCLLPEIQILEQLHHPNVIKLLDYYDEPLRYILILQYAQGGDLFDRILSQNSPFTEQVTQGILLQLIEGISYLHSKNILHCDIKPENILLPNTTDETNILLCDFGVSAHLSPNTTPHPEKNIGTLRYRAPEMFADSPHSSFSYGVDVWSLGVVLFICLSGSFPFDHEDERVVAERIKAGKVEFPPNTWVCSLYHKHILAIKYSLHCTKY